MLLIGDAIIVVYLVYWMFIDTLWWHEILNALLLICGVNSFYETYKKLIKEKKYGKLL